MIIGKVKSERLGSLQHQHTVAKSVEVLFRQAGLLLPSGFAKRYRRHGRITIYGVVEGRKLEVRETLARAIAVNNLDEGDIVIQNTTEEPKVNEVPLNNRQSEKEKKVATQSQPNGHAELRPRKGHSFKQMIKSSANVITGSMQRVSFVSSDNLEEALTEAFEQGEFLLKKIARLVEDGDIQINVNDASQSIDVLLPRDAFPDDRQTLMTRIIKKAVQELAPRYTVKVCISTERECKRFKPQVEIGDVVEFTKEDVTSRRASKNSFISQLYTMAGYNQ